MAVVADGTHRESAAHRLALVGVLAPPIFVVVLIALGLIKPGYDPVAKAVSNGAVGQLGWVQTLNFLVLGAALLLFAVGSWQGFGNRLSGRIGSALLAFAGVGLLGAGVFVTDPGFRDTTFHGNMHQLFSMVTFLSLTIAGFVFARRFWPDWRFALYSIFSGLVIPASFVATPGHLPIAGLIQRVMIVLVWTWLTIVAVRLRRSTA